MEPGEFTVKVRDKVVADLIKEIARRSNDGASEYEHESLTDRIKNPVMLVREALEEAIDQMIYLGAALSVMSDMESEIMEDIEISQFVKKYQGIGKEMEDSPRLYVCPERSDDGKRCCLTDRHDPGHISYDGERWI